jgi:cardiolipin synthase
MSEPRHTDGDSVRTGVAATLAGGIEPQRYRRLLEGFTGVPATEGNQVDVLRNGVEIFPAMLDAIERAERSIDLLTYIYWTGDIERHEALRNRAVVKGHRLRALAGAW